MKKETLGKHIIQLRGVSYKSHEISSHLKEGFIPLIKIYNITEDGFNKSNLSYIKKDKIKDENLIKKGDIILATSSGIENVIGKGIFFETDFNGSFHTFCRLIRSQKTLYPGYLKHFLKTSYYKKYINKAVQRKNIQYLNNKYIDNMLIPIPENYDDQIRIYMVLSHVELLITKRKESIHLLDELVKSIFHQMFGDPSKNEKGWPITSIGSFADIITGPFGSSLQKEDYITGGHPFINSNHVYGGGIKPDFNLTVSKEKYKKLSKYHLNVGDIVLTRRGNSAVVRDHSTGLLCGRGSMAIRINAEFSAIFFQHQIKNLFLKSVLERESKGVGMKNINFSIVKKLKVIIPPLSIQDKFSHVVKHIESLRTNYEVSLKQLNNLYKSLNHSAFSSELDLSLIPVEKLLKYKNDSVNLGGKTSVLKTKKIFSEKELIGIIKSKLDGLFGFDELWEIIENGSYEVFPEYEDVKKMIFTMLDGELPILSQIFDKEKKEILLRLNI
ncbi:restriction endonuclease subunit S [Priestia aryabhattai]|uniref:restriction endonuclease subunit S n=1 Tax=Priestia aryabhattai TaxID=412384 RepID=UPI001C8F0EA8|nr:restriction endonuclease subunit S [Priestia aryabhattai]MBX9986360.1 restriction endonuclease subunit S [Priestia aryabhattai]MBY0001971.1 restriction endonuclease subunit S [Priestia aryabhattai]